MADTHSSVRSTETHNDSIAFGVTSLVTGILSPLFGIIIFLSIPLGAIAVVFGTLGLRRSAGRGLSIAGLITGIIGLAIGLFFVILIVISTAGAPTLSTPQYYY